MRENQRIMKSTIYRFDPVIYPFPLLVTKDYDSKDLGDLFYCVDENYELVDKPSEFVPNPYTVARTICVVSKKDNQRYYLIMLCKPRVIGSGTISHESLHIVNMIADALGFLPRKSNEDEPCGYLIQWVDNCVTSVKRGKPWQMKGEKVEII